jgi:NADH dehydrogenase [ubiquinone] 1 alpha subcomplex assembly factor 6
VFSFIIIMKSAAKVCGLLMPAHCRDTYFALRAFNVEIASIKDTVGQHNFRSSAASSNNSPTETSSFALQLRMQWWKNAVTEIHTKDRSSSSTDVSVAPFPAKVEPSSSSTAAAAPPPTAVTPESVKIDIVGLATSCWNNPVVRALSRAHDQSPLTQRFLERLIDTREVDLDIQQYQSIDELIRYGEATQSTLVYLILEGCFDVRDTDNSTENEEIDAVASAAGIGIALTTALRATPHRLAASSNEVPLPAELLRPFFPYEQILPTYLKTDDDNSTTNSHDSAAVPQQEQKQYRGNILSESDTALWNEAVKYTADVALHFLRQAQQTQGRIPKHARSCLLPVVPALLYHEKLQAANYNLFLASSSSSDRLRLLLTMGRTWLTGVF